jgi:hypothetical protein
MTFQPLLAWLTKHIILYLFKDRELDLSVVGKSLRLVMTQWVRHLATSLLKSSNDK